MRVISLLGTSWMAGIMISFGCMAYLSVSNNFVGAFLFSVGLCCVLGFRYSLFTGKTYTIYNTCQFWELPVIYIGNFIGTVWMSTLNNYFIPDAIEKIQAFAIAKIELAPEVLIARGILCNMLIAMAVKWYNTHEGFSCYLGALLTVPCFILCGFEHSIADMFYFSASGMPIADWITPLMMITFGNLLGGLVFWCLDNLVPNANEI